MLISRRVQYYNNHQDKQHISLAVVITRSPPIQLQMMLKRISKITIYQELLIAIECSKYHQSQFRTKVEQLVQPLLLKAIHNNNSNHPNILIITLLCQIKRIKIRKERVQIIRLQLLIIAIVILI